jgi:uncharacterized RDD family membrane protein YckC
MSADDDAPQIEFALFTGRGEREAAMSQGQDWNAPTATYHQPTFGLPFAQSQPGPPDRGQPSPQDQGQPGPPDQGQSPAPGQSPGPPAPQAATVPPPPGYPPVPAYPSTPAYPSAQAYQSAQGYPSAQPPQPPQPGYGQVQPGYGPPQQSYPPAPSGFQPAQPGVPAAQPGYPPAQPGYGYPQAPGYQAGPAAPYQQAAQLTPYGGYGAPGMAPAPAVPPGYYYDPLSGLTLPQGTQLASAGRRIGSYFLAIPLVIVTLGIGYLIWGLIAWSNGQTPTQSLLGLQTWKPQTGTNASWGGQFVRELSRVLYAIPFVGWIIAIVSFVMFLSGKERRALHDAIGGTVVLYDPGRVLQSPPYRPVM